MQVQRRHVERAIADVTKRGTPQRRASTKYVLLANGQELPPKYVMALALKYAVGREPTPDEHEGGEQTNRVLRNLGYTVVRSVADLRDIAPACRRLLEAVQDLRIEYLRWCRDEADGEGIGSEYNGLVVQDFLPTSTSKAQLAGQLRGLAVHVATKSAAIGPAALRAAAHEVVAIYSSCHEVWWGGGHDFAVLKQLRAGSGAGQYRLQAVASGRIWRSPADMKRASTFFALRGLLLENYYGMTIGRGPRSPTGRASARALAKALSDDIARLTRVAPNARQVVQSGVVPRVLGLAAYLRQEALRIADHDGCRRVLDPAVLTAYSPCAIDCGPIAFPRVSHPSCAATLVTEGRQGLKRRFEVVDYGQFLNMDAGNSKAALTRCIDTAERARERYQRRARRLWAED